MEQKDSEYYMGNHDMLPTIITFKSRTNVITYELPWDADADMILNAVYSGMIGLTFRSDRILQAMQDFVDDNKKIGEGHYEELEGNYEEARLTHKFNIGDKVKIINGIFSENTIDGKILDIVYLGQDKVLYKVSFMLLEKNKITEDGTIPGIFMVEIINENALKLDI